MRGRPSLPRLPSLVLVICAPLGAAEFDPSKLPPPATNRVVFAADVKPILETRCLRCHGPEKPKSGFRLTDRALALKGGANGIDIVPGNSAQSPLVYYVARLVPDMEMPPESKGEPLTPGQVAILRAWIDQGVRWDTAAAAGTPLELSLSPQISWTSVSGDRSMFRELEWQPEGWNGGAAEFGLNQKFADGRSVSLEGHALLNDYALRVELRKPDLGYSRFSFEQYRKYYSDAGGYLASFSPPLLRLEEDLHLDIGHAGVEFGLTLPNWPRVVLSYDYAYKEGEKSMLTWGSVFPPTGDPANLRNIYPSTEELDEHTHTVRLGVSYVLGGYEFDNELRVDVFETDAVRKDALLVASGAASPSLQTAVQEDHSYTQVADAVRLQKQWTDWWLTGVGYRYSWLDGDSSLRLSPQDGQGQLSAGSAWEADNIVLSEVWQIANGYSQFRLLPQLTATAAVQGQWKDQDTFGKVNLHEISDPADPTAGIDTLRSTERSTLDQTGAEENLLVRYTGLPFTSLFAEALLKQEDYSRTAEQPPPSPHAVNFASDAEARWQEYRAGFNCSPWQRTSFAGTYRHRDRATDYEYTAALEPGRYPGFIRERDVASDGIDARLTFTPAGWVRTTFSYGWTESEFRTRTGPGSVLFGPDATPGGGVYAGNYLAHTASANVNIGPFRRMYFSGTLSYQTSRTTTFNSDSVSIVPYDGNLWSVVASATYLLNKATDLFAAYSFSIARYGQQQLTAGLPLGLDYDRHGLQAGVVRRFGQHLSARLQYGWFDYDEPTSGHLRDYTAHQVLAIMGTKW